MTYHNKLAFEVSSCDYTGYIEGTQKNYTIYYANFTMNITMN